MRLQVECTTSLSRLQKRDIGEGFNDIKYNLLIGKHGVVEGRGYDIAPELEAEYFSIGLFTDDLYKPGEYLNGTLVRIVQDANMIGKLKKIVRTTCASVCSEAPIFS